MEQKLKIPLASALALAAFGSVLFGAAVGVVMVLGHNANVRRPEGACATCRCGVNCRCPSCVCEPPRVLPKSKYEAPISGDCLPAVNDQALKEPKTGIFGNRVYPQAQVVYTPVQPQTVQPCVPCQPAKPAAPASPAKPAAAPNRLTQGDQPAQESLRYQISLYLLPGDPKSEQLKKWFETDATLTSWRSQCTYQEYTPDNRLYQTLRTSDGRYLKDVVPVNEFPAIVVTKPDGGHIHAAGKAFIPATAAELVSDVQKANVLAKQVPVDSGRVLSSGYSWDSEIAPQLRLSSNPVCPGDNCQPQDAAEDKWVPGERIRDLFATKAIEKTGWAKDALWGWLDIIVAGIIAVLVIVVFGFLGLIALVALFYFIRKSGS